jgi:hypothetical protein
MDAAGSEVIEMPTAGKELRHVSRNWYLSPNHQQKRPTKNKAEMRIATQPAKGVSAERREARGETRDAREPESKSDREQRKSDIRTSCGHLDQVCHPKDRC